MNELAYLDVLDKTRVYPEAGYGTVAAITYCALGLVGEAGEFANQVKKILRDDGDEITEERLLKLVDELGDTYWYLRSLVEELGTSMSELRNKNAAKLLGRKREGTLHGDNREGTFSGALQRLHDSQQSGCGCF